MTDTPEPSDRDDFEAWLMKGGTAGSALDRDDVGYVVSVTAACWEAWQAAAALYRKDDPDLTTVYMVGFEKGRDAERERWRKAVGVMREVRQRKTESAIRGLKEAGAAYVTYDGSAYDLNRLSEYVIALESAVDAMLREGEGK